MSIKKSTFDNPSIPKTISQSIYSDLRNAVVTNKRKTDQRIIEKDIAKMFDASTTPVREALLLAADGYFFIDSKRKTVAKEIS